MKKILTGGFISLSFGLLMTMFSLGGGIVGADTASDPSADAFRILLYLGGGFLTLGLILIISATVSLRR